MLNRDRLKTVMKHAVRPLIYRFPPVFLSPTSTYMWFDSLLKTKDLKGDVVEVGCYLGGTAAQSIRLLEGMKSPRDYYVMDTYGGFDTAQYDSEVKLGGTNALRREFSGNSPELARWVMNKHGGKNVKMIEGDVTKLPNDKIPARISACLLDIDLADPIYFGLCRLYPRLEAGGIIVVDDCDENTMYKARIGYERFMNEQGLAIDLRLGMGVVTKP